MASGLCAALTGRTHGCTDQAANVKKALANAEPSTHGTKRTWRDFRPFVRFWGEADMRDAVASTAIVVNDRPIPDMEGTEILQCSGLLPRDWLC
jgi:hypothetical protein